MKRNINKRGGRSKLPDNERKIPVTFNIYLKQEDLNKIDITAFKSEAKQHCMALAENHINNFK